MKPILATLMLALTGLFTAGVLYRLWRPTTPTPGVRPKDAGRLRIGLIAAIVAICVVGGGGLASALFTSSDAIVSNQFGTGCFDAQVSATQSGQVTNNAEGTQAISITAVDPASSILVTSVRSSSAEPADSMVMATLASATEIQLVRRTDAGSVPDIVVQWTVIEYGCGVTVQRGTTAGDGTDTVDVAITPVTTASSFVLTSSVPDRADAAHDGDDDHLASLPNVSTVRLEAAAGGSLPANHSYAWQVVSFADSNDASVQTATETLSGTNSATVTLGTAVDLSTTLVIAHAASAGTGADIGERAARVHLASTTTVEVARQLSGDSLEVSLQVITFTDGTVVQHGILNMGASTSSATVTVNPVDSGRAAALSTVMTPGSASGGSTDMNSAAVLGEASATFEVTDPSTVTVTRAASTAAVSFGWQLVEWGGPQWWDTDYAYRQRVDVATSSTAAPDAYNVPVTLNHSALVADSLSRGDGQDVRVLRWNGSSWTELHRVLDDGSAWSATDTTVWFRTTDAIAASSTHSYWVYYGNTAPSTALADPEQVWLLTEDFESGTLGDFEDRTGGTAWYQAEPWTSRIPLTIQSSQVDGDLAGFAVYVQLTDAALGSGAATDGSDIRFTASDGTTPLAHEIETWTAGTGALGAWVSVPAVSASSDTTIYLYYSAGDAPDQQDPATVWNGTAGAWHLSADPSGPAPQVDDSSQNRRDGLSAGAMGSGDLVTGRAGSAIDVDGTDDRLEIEPFDMGGRTWTVSGWVKLDSVSGDQVLVAKADDDTTRVFSLGTTGTQARFQLRASGADYVVAGGTLSTGTWYHLAGTWNGADMALFVDGVSVATGAALGELQRDAEMPVSIGNLPGDEQPLDGTVDEVRLEPSVRTTDWLTASFRNLSNPGTFVTAGTTQAGSWLGQGTWSYRKPITVDGAYVSASLTDQPLLVQFVDATVAVKLQTDGDDLVFTAADGTTRLDHQLELTDNGTGAVTAWVKIPTLTAGANTELFVYYGNASADDQQDPEAVFGSDADLVFHGS